MRAIPLGLAGLTAAWVGAAFAAPGGSGKAVPGHAPGRADVEFFERSVRPVLAENCYSCHGPRVQQGGLRLDLRPGLIKGGASGPALVPGLPEKSRLIQAVRHQGLEMPPGKKLPDAQIAALEKWVRMGAPWPAEAAAAPALGDQIAIFRKARTHWAFRPLRAPALPPVRNRAWVRNPIDAFVLSRLEKAGMSPSPPADRRTLLRRVYFDLIGLPPTVDEIEAFARDRSPDAYEKVVDRLLASPRYGERWGRHWLDVARYADTKDGVLMYGDARVRPYAYTYRDYVIRALNEDTPYDRFVEEQLAADQIQPPVERWRLGAMGFLTLGRMFDNNIHDVIDDRIDTVSRGFLGLTAACARCHDHKYDPIPQADYYSLYGVFASSEVPLELPLIEEASNLPAKEFERQAAAKRAELRNVIDTQYALQSEAARARVADYLVKAGTEKPDPLETAIFFLSLAPEDLRPQITARWRRYLERRSQPDDPVFGPWHDLMSAADPGSTTDPQANRWKGMPEGMGAGQVNPRVKQALAAARITGRVSVARAYGDLFQNVYAESKSGQPLSEATRQLLAVVTGPDSPTYFPKSQTWNYMSRGDKDAYGGKVGELDVMAVKASSAPARAMVLVDSDEIQEPRIFTRGNPSAPGERVPRQFFKILAGDRRQPFPHGSGRLDLARAIASPENPLTARVMVDRVWMEHLGDPLAPSPSDFGLRSAPPTNPELLDWLAATFVTPDLEPQRHEGTKRELASKPGEAVHSGAAGMNWSLKQLHRLIVLSNTYRQASLDRPECRRKDPENRLLWRANRRRLDLEPMRDAMLAVSGRLDLTTGGRPVDVAGDPTCPRRTVYGLVDRQNVPEFYRAFDFASPDASAERRPRTTVPQQALFGMNAPFVQVQARALAGRKEVTAETDPARRVRALYRLVLARDPVPRETEAGLRFVQGAAPTAGQLSAWEQYAQVLLLTNEFLFID